jgi:sulfur relay protein, TusE/DsrC/DsvC family
MSLEITDQGFLVKYADWNEAVAKQLAWHNQIDLSAEHWEIILFIRGYYLQFKHLPNARVFTKAVAKKLGRKKVIVGIYINCFLMVP